MKSILDIVLLLLLTYYQNGYGQEGNLEGPILNLRTEKHLNKTGTKLFIIPPPGFMISSNFDILQKDPLTYIHIMVFDKVPFGNFAEKILKNNFGNFNKDSVLIKDVIFNNAEAKWIILKGGNDTGYGLLIGDEEYSAFLFGISAKGDQQMQKEIRTSLLSAVYDKNFNNNLSENKPYTLKLDEEKFYVTYEGYNFSTYSIHAASLPQECKASIVVGITPTPENYSLMELSNTLYNSMKESGFQLHDDKSTIVTKNEKRLYEIEYFGKLNGEDVVIFNRILSNGYDGIIVRGQSSSHFDESLILFREFANSLFFKE
jgi:hypothetical protein